MSSHELVIEELAGEPIGVLRIAGELHLGDVPRLMTTLAAAMRRMRVVVCDVNELTPASSMFLTAFPAALHRFGDWPHGSLHLAAPNDELAYLLRRMRMPAFVPVHTTLQAAIDQALLDVPEPFGVVLDPDPASLDRVRSTVRAIWPASTPVGREEGVLVANELATNAVRHTWGPFTVSLAPGSEDVLIAVSDASRAEPILRPSNVSSIGGLGMQLVSILSLGRWGCRLIHEDGKTVWARLPALAPGAAVPRPRSDGFA